MLTQTRIGRENCARFKQFFIGDMNQVKITEILRFPSDDGVLFNHVWGKTLRDDDNNVFGIKRNPQTKICPQCSGNRTLHGSGSATKDQFNAGIPLNPTTPQGGILDATFSSTAAEVRLKRYLWEMGSDN